MVYQTRIRFRRRYFAGRWESNTIDKKLYLQNTTISFESFGQVWIDYESLAAVETDGTPGEIMIASTWYLLRVYMDGGICRWHYNII